MMTRKLLILTAALALAACTSNKKSATDDEAVAQQAEPVEHEVRKHHEHADGEEHGHEEHGHGEHGPHGHRFEEPSKYAERWNDPERDTWQKPDELIALMEIEPGMTVADLGAGTGYMLPHLSEAVGEQGEVLALDGEDAMIAYLEEHREQLGANVRPVKVPWDAPGVEAQSLDRLVTINTWHHVRDREAYAAKVYEALKPGGRFVVVDFTMDAPMGPPKEMRLAPEAIVAELEAGGFEASIAEETMPRHHVVIGVRR